jgi:Flp pilus assembly protein CpaB
MTSLGPRTLPPQTVSSNGYHPSAGVGPPLSTRHRPKGYAALAVALILGFGALGFYFYAQAGSKVPVVVAARDIPAGHTISRADLSTVEVAGGVTAVAGAHLSSLVGQTATVEILPGTLVQRSMATASSSLSPSQALVGVALGPGQIPSSGLVPGDRVEVLQLPPKSSGGSTTGSSAVLTASAVVYDARANPAAAGGSLLTLLVARSDALGIEAASNAGLVAVVKVGGSP